MYGTSGITGKPRFALEMKTDMTGSEQLSAPRSGEFIALMAFLMSLAALSIDMILPGFYLIGATFEIVDANQLQLIIGVLFLGLAIGQLFYGPLSDSIGRKPTIYIGLVLFAVGSLVSALATDYDTMLYGRFLQGFGVAAPRTVSIALVRDQYSGREMARIMSFVIMIFILTPALAPGLGALVLMVSGWQTIFFSSAFLSMLALAWLFVRQVETHPKEKRIPFRPGVIFYSSLEVLKNRQSGGYMIVGGLFFSCLVTYLNTAKLLYLDLYQIDEMFPVYFGMLALAIGAASIANSQLVVKYGMRALMHVALTMMMIVSAGFLAYILLTTGHPPFLLFMIVMAVIFFFLGILFGNCNALAMEPVGHIAGVGSSIIGGGMTFISMSLGALVGQLYDQTLLPMVAGFTLFTILSFILMQWIEKPKQA